MRLFSSASHKLIIYLEGTCYIFTFRKPTLLLLFMAKAQVVTIRTDSLH
jgi:hypothetical protein